MRIIDHYRTLVISCGDSPDEEVSLDYPRVIVCRFCRLRLRGWPRHVTLSGDHGMCRIAPVSLPTRTLGAGGSDPVNLQPSQQS